MPFRLNRFKKSLTHWPFITKLHLPHGLFGFEDAQEFLLKGNQHEIPFLWLENWKKDLSFVVIDPFLAVSDYDVLITKKDLEDLNIKNHQELFLLSIVNTNFKPHTINLSSPILIDWQERMGRQILVPFNPVHPIDSTIF